MAGDSRNFLPECRLGGFFYFESKNARHAAQFICAKNGVNDENRD